MNNELQNNERKSDFMDDFMGVLREYPLIIEQCPVPKEAK